MRHVILPLSGPRSSTSSNEFKSGAAPSLPDLAEDRRAIDSAADTGDGLYRLRSALPRARYLGAEDIAFSEVAEAADRCEPGQLVPYRIGVDQPERTIADSLARGAAGILTEQLLPCPLPQCVVPDLDAALASIASAQLGRPDRQLLTVGVVGSAGKTTTALLIASLMRSSGHRTAFQTDLGECDGVVQTASDQGVPAGIDLVGWLSEANDCGCQAAIIEIAENDARRGSYDAMEFDVVVITGTSHRRSDFGPNALYHVLDRVAHDGVVVAPQDDDSILSMIEDCDAHVVCYSTAGSAAVSGQVLEQAGGVMTMTLSYGDTTAAMETRLCGSAMACNVTAAATVGVLIGQRLEDIAEHLGQLTVVPGRGQRFEEFGRAAVVLDVAGTPHRAASALRTHREMKSNGRLWCILAVDGSEPSGRLAHYGSLVERFADHTIITSKSGCKQAFLSGSHQVLDGVKNCAALRLVADPQRAIEWAIGEAGPDDTILVLTGKESDTAHQQRSDVQRITRWIEQARQDGASTSETRPKLSVFRG